MEANSRDLEASNGVDLNLERDPSESDGENHRSMPMEVSDGTSVDLNPNPDATEAIDNEDSQPKSDSINGLQYGSELHSGEDDDYWSDGSTSETYEEYPATKNEFEHAYASRPLSLIGKSHLERGDQIIMPASAFDCLMETRVDYPMLFEIRNESEGRVSHCGVSEFTAEEGFVFLPNWMMENMLLQDGDLVSLKYCRLERGTYMKLQPHSKDFLGIGNPKAALEEALGANFFCLTSGDTIKINHNNKDFYINVLETKPSAAICIVDTDSEVDFAAPVDYVEPAKPEEVRIAKVQNFVPFTGLVRRLDEKYSVELPTEPKSMAVDGEPSMTTEPEFRSCRNSRTLVFGPSEHKIGEGKEFNEEEGTEKPKKRKFQPFTGKKYSLID